MRKLLYKAKILLTAALLFGYCIVALGQEAHFNTPLSSSPSSYLVDLAQFSYVNGAVISLRNDSGSSISFPRLWNSQSKAPIASAKAFAGLAAQGYSDEAIAIQIWQYVVNQLPNGYCSAGSPFEYASDPLRILYGYGFGCCDQQANTLGWLWAGAGYQSRIAVFDFHTVPEIFYGGAWHMLDPNHKVLYRNPDGSIASVAQILADTSIVASTADGAGWNSQKMADLYAANASSLRYSPVWFTQPPSVLFTLLPHEQVDFRENTWPSMVYAVYGTGYPPSVGIASFRRRIDFQQSWSGLVDGINNVVTAPQADGRNALIVGAGGTGSILLKKASPFPALGVQLTGEFFSKDSAATISVSASVDGKNWSLPQAVPIVVGAKPTSYSVDLSQALFGTNTYYVQVIVSGGAAGGAGIYNLELRCDGQMSLPMMPQLIPGAVNILNYADSSPDSQVRNLRLEVAIPNGSTKLSHLTAISLTPESPTSSIARGYAAARLVDSNSDTLAYPGATQLDYKIGLGASTRVKQVSIDWGYFGKNPIYISNWTLYGRTNASATWTALQSGTFPGQLKSDIPVDFTGTELRITASSSNWIGLYELQVYGDQIATIPASAMSTQSLVPESPIYSLARNYGAANLTDGKPTTLAYPGRSSLDYVSNLGGKYHLSSATINWGYFGLSPIYVNSWSLFGKQEGGSWESLASGGSPNGAITNVDLETTVTDLRLSARSDVNWIGAYDLSVAGSQKLQPISVTSNVPVNSDKYPTSNLVDGDSSTLAYPGGVQVDYQLDFGTDTPLDFATIHWGYFGSSPLYVQNWQVLGQANNDIGWTPVASGGYPGTVESQVGIHRSFRRLRVKASGPNWLGIYEMSVNGVPAPAAAREER